MSVSSPKIGVFGGSFDPIHVGHVEPVKEAAAANGIERVVFLPTGRPPHKKREFAPALMRYAMVELALLDEPALVVDSLELGESAPSYTIETIELFERRYPEATLCLFLGADSYLELPTWRRWRELVERTEVVVLARPGYAIDLEENDEVARQARKVSWHSSHQLEVSSTEIRRKLHTQGTVESGLLHPRVLTFCRKYALYR